MTSIHSVISRFKKSKDGKRLAKNFGYLSLLELASHFFPLITLPYLARTIGTEGFGILAIGASVVHYFQSFTNYGFEYLAVRDLARNRDNVQESSRIVFTTFFSKLFLMLVSIAIVAVLIWLVPFFSRYSVVIWCTFLLLPGHALTTDWVFQAYEEMQFITIRSLFSKLFFTLMVFVVIRSKDDYLWQPVLNAIGFLIPAIWGLIVLVRRYHLKLMVPSLNTVWGEMKRGFNMFITVFLPTIYTNLNVLILGAYNSNYATGIYNGGSKFTGLAFSFFKLISRTVYPFFARRMDKHKFYVRFSLAVAILISLFFFFLARPIVAIFLGPEFKETVKVLRIVAFTPIAMSLMNSYGVNYLVLKGRERLMSRIILCVTVFGVIIGIIGAIRYSFIGVAVASLVTQMLRALLITYYARRIDKEELLAKQQI
ncbi:MAG: flippase [Bacteroidales bacterium]|nr:flippase [Bacteroidales bacterium]